MHYIDFGNFSLIFKCRNENFGIFDGKFPEIRSSFINNLCGSNIEY